MGKKSIDRKAVNQFIIDSRKQGKSDQDIYMNLPNNTTIRRPSLF